MPSSNLSAVAPIPPNSAATIGLFDSRFGVLDRNIRAVDAAIANIVAVSDTAITLVPYGGNGTGTADNHNALALAQVAAATIPGRGISQQPGTYRVDSDITITVPQQIAAGFMYQPANGVTITFDELVDAGPYQWMDFSLGGNFVFTKQRRFAAEWFGLTDDGTDMGPVLTTMSTVIPEYSVVEFERTNVVYSLATTWTIPNRKGITFTSHVDARIPDAGSPTLLWTGAAHGTMIFMDKCKNCLIEGFRVNSGTGGGLGADIMVDIDGWVSGNIGTQCALRWCSFKMGSQNPDCACVYLSRTVFSNQEYHRVTECAFEGGGGAMQDYSASISHDSGSNILTTTETFFVSQVGQNVYLENGQVSTVTEYTDATHVKMADDATSSASSQQAKIGRKYGVAIKLGISANVKFITLDMNNINECQYAIWQLGGSYRSQYNSFTDCMVAHKIDNSIEPNIDFQCSAEHCWQYIVTGSTEAFTILGGRVDIQNTPPGRSSLESVFARIPCRGMKTENNLKQGAFLTNAKARDDVFVGGLFSFEDCRFGEAGMTIAQITGGGDLFNSVSVARCRELVGGWPSATAYHGKTVYVTGTDLPAVYGRAKMVGGIGQLGTFVGEMSSSGGGSAGVDQGIGFRSQVDATLDVSQVNQKVFIGHEAKHSGISIDTADRVWEDTGFKCRTPGWTGPGSVMTSLGFHCEPQTTAQTPGAFAFKSDGTLDPCQFAGPVILIGGSLATTGTALAPSRAFSSESSLGWYRSGVSTVAMSYGTLNLASNAVRLSMRTMAASAVTASAANTNVIANEVVFTVGGASGASLCIHSGGTVYIFSSVLSAKAT